MTEEERDLALLKIIEGPNFEKNQATRRFYGETYTALRQEIETLDEKHTALFVEGMLIFARNRMGSQNPVIELLAEAKLAEAEAVEAQKNALHKRISGLWTEAYQAAGLPPL